MSDVLRDLINKDDFMMPEKLASNLDKFTTELKASKIHFDLRKYLTASALIFVILTAYTAGTYALGYKVPLVDGLISIFNSDPNIKNYAMNQNQFVSRNGITISIDDTIFDESTLTVNLTVNGENLKDKLGNEVNMTGLGLLNGDNALSGALYGGEYVDGNTYKCMLSYSISKNLPEQFKLDYRIYLGDKDNKPIEGSWNFVLNLDKTRIAKDSKIFTSDTILDFLGGKVKVSKISFTPSKVSVVLKAVEGERTPNLEEYGPAGFLMFDENGNELPVVGLELRRSSDDPFTGIFEYYKPERVPTSVTLVPFKGSPTANDNQKVLAVPLSTSLPVTLKRNCGSSITIKKIVQDSQNTKITFTAELSSPDYEIYPSVRNSKGEEVYAVGGENYKRQGNKIELTSIFPALPEGESYSIFLDDPFSYQIFKDQSIKISLSE